MYNWKYKDFFTFLCLKQLGLKEIKPTTIRLQLANYLVKVLRGVIEDVLIQIGKFYYFVYFVMLDMYLVLYANV